MFHALVVFCLASISVFSAIFEIAHFNELERYVGSDSMLLLDIDDTLITPKQMLGNDTWFGYRCKKYQDDGCSPSAALEKTLAEFEAIRHLSRMGLVEPHIADVIQSVQKEGCRVMGITIQGLALASRTVLQLSEHEIDLSQTSQFPDDFCFSVQNHAALFRRGIIFTSGKSKGEAFFRFCDILGNLPKKIVAVDDKLTHLQSIEKEAQERGVEFIGLRYKYSDVKKRAFSPQIVDYQLNHSTITHLLSDEEARAALNID
jgi:hypothetical protein